MCEVERNKVSATQWLLVVKLKRAILHEQSDDVQAVLSSSPFSVGLVCDMGGTLSGFDPSSSPLLPLVASAHKPGGSYNVADLARIRASEPTRLDRMDLYAYMLHLSLVSPVVGSAAAALARSGGRQRKDDVDPTAVPAMPNLTELHSLTQSLLR